VIGCYLVDTDEGLALHDCGPATCVPRLHQALAEHGVTLTDVSHLLLSHIHLDHAGAAGVLVREHPALQVHVSEVGAPHLADPSRLERSARRLYGDAFDELWGELAPVPEANIRVVESHAAGLEAFPTRGHAEHHVSYLTPDGTLLAGDAAGVRILPDAFVSPPTVPPEFDLETWLTTIDEIEQREPERLALIHFGVVEDVAPHLEQLRERLRAWTANEAPEEEWYAHRRRERADGSDDAELNELAMPLEQSYAGLRRYWDKRADAAAAG